MVSPFRRVIRVLIVTFFVGVAVVLIFATWYKYTYSMDEAEPRSINDPKLSTKILIATQGSKFKDAVVNGVIEKLQDRPIYISVVDVSELANVKASDWAAIVILHTWEIGEPPEVVAEFVETTNASELIMLTTSGDGHYHIEGVDGITSASKSTEVDNCVREILNRIEIKIAPEEISNYQ